MQYYSTNHHSEKTSFKQAIEKSESRDGGLYMPEKLPTVPKAFLNNIMEMPLADLSFVLSSLMLPSDVPSAVLKKICEDSSCAPMPLYEIEKGIYVLETFHGPTNSIKDFGATFLGGILRSTHRYSDRPINVMVATTGHSGAAIARALHDIDGVNVFVLYPKGIVKQYLDIFASMGNNIHTIEVNGTIDHCREMITKAFEDPELNENSVFTSANSTNIGYIIPTISIFFNAYAQLLKVNEKPGDIYISIPTGNCGNLISAYMAKKMGLPVKRIIGACNENGALHTYLTKGYQTTKVHTKNTLSYSIDTTTCANLPRLEDLCGGDIESLRADICTDICTDAEIADVINEVYERHGYLMDPHAAVGYKCLKSCMPQGATGIFLATAHPNRATETLEKINRGALNLPYRIRHNFCRRAEVTIPPSYAALKKILKYYSTTGQLQIIS